MNADPTPTGSAELTLRALALGMILSVVLAAANAYLGLKVGMTVSASIPAAVISMGVLKLLRRSCILENNLVQTAASAGESLAAGVIFTLPALILLGHWQGFPFLAVSGIALVGGLIGVGFSIPLRRVLLAEPELRFPEGVATAEVLQAGHGERGGMRLLMIGALAAALIKVCQGGLRVLAGSVGGAVTIRGGVFAAGADLSAALVAVGFIVRLPIAILMFAGGVLAWLIAIPIYTAIHGVPEGVAGYEAAFVIWNSKIRYLGVGAMVVGGLWSLIALGRPILRGLQTTLSMRGGAESGRREQDTPFPILAAGLVVLLLPLLWIYHQVVPSGELGIGSGSYILILVVTVGLAYLGGFLFSAVAGYMAGLVGSSNNPISGVTIATILVTSLILYALLGSTDSVVAAAATAILVGSVVCCAAAISGDNLQDLKAGQLVGATPWRQQLMQVLGVAAGALTIGPVLNLLYQAYGLGDSLPRAGMDPTQALAAPQANLMKTVALGVFERNLDWAMISMGAGLAVVVIVLDEVLKARKTGFRAPVLAVAVGIYLPIELTVPILLGGLVSYAATRSHAGGNRGLLLASGLIAGEALAGIALAIPFALSQNTDVLRIVPEGFAAPATVLGVLAALSILYALYRAER